MTKYNTNSVERIERPLLLYTKCPDCGQYYCACNEYDAFIAWQEDNYSLDEYDTQI